MSERLGENEGIESRSAAAKSDGNAPEISLAKNDNHAPEIPAAKNKSRWRNRVSLAGTVLVGVILVLVGYSCLKPNDRSSYSAPVQRLAAAPSGVTYVPNGMLYLIAQSDGSFLALDEQDRVTANRLNGCIVRWLPDMRGVFQESQRCGGATFARDGSAVAGGQALLRHPVRLASKNVVVDIRHCIAPEDGAIRLCKAFRR